MKDNEWYLKNSQIVIDNYLLAKEEYNSLLKVLYSNNDPRVTKIGKFAPNPLQKLLLDNWERVKDMRLREIGRLFDKHPQSVKFAITKLQEHGMCRDYAVLYLV